MSPDIKVTGEEKKSHIGNACSYTGAGCSKKGFPIVPVKVERPGKKTVNYDLCTSRQWSNCNFCTDNLLRKHDVSGMRFLLQQVIVLKKSKKVSWPVLKLAIMTKTSC